tara:strand:- start:44 stop:163 length:120 start_codon:yes stop_codon:yes gene_type:complete
MDYTLYFAWILQGIYGNIGAFPSPFSYFEKAYFMKNKLC